MDSGTDVLYSAEDVEACLCLAKRMARRWTRSHADAEDVAQDAMILLLRSGRKPERLAPWMFVVTRRVAARRSARDTRRADVERTFHDLHYCARISRDRVIDALTILTRLGRVYRLVLTRVVQGRVSREIAEELGRKERDIGQLVARARKRANAFLDPGASEKVRRRDSSITNRTSRKEGGGLHRRENES